MDKNITKVIVAFVLVVFAIFMITRLMKGSKARRIDIVSLPVQGVNLSTPEETNIKPIESQAVVSQTGIIKEKKGTDDWKRDPFIIIEKDLADLERKFSAKDEFKKPELSQLKLTGIIFSKEKSADNYAVISDQLLKVGDQIMGFKVAEVRPNSVILKWENQEFILELWQEQPK